MKILIIDDSHLSRSLFMRALGEEHTYIQAENGNSGIEQYFLEKPDLVILDLTMPDMNGYKTIEKLLELDPHARVLIGTADIQDSSREMVMALGAAGLITKPFTPEGVKKAVNDALANQDFGIG